MSNKNTFSLMSVVTKDYVEGENDKLLRIITQHINDSSVHGGSNVGTVIESPIGSICWFNQTTPPKGWAVCNGHWYGYDPSTGTLSESTTQTTICNIQTPNLIGMYPLGANEDIGTSVSAGLPNIVGGFPGIGEANDRNWNLHPIFSGAFYELTSDYNQGVINFNGDDAEHDAGKDDYFRFDASKGTTDTNGNIISQANSPYGKSNTVTPPSIKLLPCMKIYNADTDTIGGLISMHNNSTLAHPNGFEHVINMNGNNVTNLGIPVNNTDAATKEYVDTTVSDHNVDDELLILREELYTLKNEMIVFPNGWNTLTLCTGRKAHDVAKTWSSGLYSNEIAAGWRFVENNTIRSYYFNGELILDVHPVVTDSQGMLSLSDSANTSVNVRRISFHKSCFVVLVDGDNGIRLVKEDSSGVPDSQPINSPFFIPGKTEDRATTPIFVLPGYTIWVAERPNMLTVCPCFESQPEQPIRVFPHYGYQLLREKDQTSADAITSYNNSEYIVNANGDDTMESGGSNVDTTNTFITYRGKTYWDDSSIRLMYKKYSGGSFNAEFEVTLRGQRGFDFADDTYSFFNYIFLIPISLIKGADESTVSLGGYGPASDGGINSCSLHWYTPSNRALTTNKPSSGTYYRCIRLATKTTNISDNFSLSTIKISISGMYE